MPYLFIQTSVHLDAEKEEKLLSKASRTVSSILGKSEAYVMVALQTNTRMIFAGSTQPTAFLSLNALELPTKLTSILSEKLCDFIQEHLEIPKERVFINFSNVEPHLWGWSGDTF